jgi:type II secretory pathway component PulF
MLLPPLTPMWCEINVLSLSLSLSLFFSLLFVIVFLLLFIYYYLFSNTIRPRKIKNEFIGIVLIGKRFDRE